MTTFTHSSQIGYDTVTRKRTWGSSLVREACIRNSLYTRGDNEAYMKLLDYVDDHEPTTKSLYIAASDINRHSKDQTITNIMFILESEAVLTTFEINGSDEI